VSFDDMQDCDCDCDCDCDFHLLFVGIPRSNSCLAIKFLLSFIQKLEGYDVEACDWSSRASGYHIKGAAVKIENSLCSFGHVFGIL